MSLSGRLEMKCLEVGRDRWARREGGIAFASHLKAVPVGISPELER